MNSGQYMRVSNIRERMVHESALPEVFYEDGHIIVRPLPGVPSCT